MKRILFSQASTFMKINTAKVCRAKELKLPLKQRGKAVVAIGEARPLVRAALEGAIPVYEVDAFSDAVARAYALAQPSGVVLLAPACASFDMFRDYAERGRTFKDEVKKLKAESR